MDTETRLVPSRLSRLAARLDGLNEFDRTPVAPDHWKGGRHFAAIFGGEHVAGTEFVIGSFFVLHGVGARDLLWGLLVGNILAVLSWTLICAPIATRTRLTLYWYLRRIGGPGLGVLYSVANGLLFCFLAGAMIALCADAVSTGLEIFLAGYGVVFAHPSLADLVPSSAGWVAIVLASGALVTTVAILGFDRMARFSTICVPWMFAIFLAGAIAVLPSLGFRTSGDLWAVAERVWDGVPRSGGAPFSCWHIASFAWFCNLCTHVDLSDMALFRFARHWGYGLYSALGMFLGHFVAWLCSGVMCAAFLAGSTDDPKLLIGRMAFEAAGFAGLLCVLAASWTTANPTLYRAGLAFQVATPDWPRWRVTLAAGIITSAAACFPLFVMNLLDFVALFGLVLMPVGAVVFAEHWFLPRVGVAPAWAERKGHFVNPAALITWVASLSVSLVGLWWFLEWDLFFVWLPGYLAALAIYPPLALAFGAREGPPESAVAAVPSVRPGEIPAAGAVRLPAGPPRREEGRAPRSRGVRRMALGILAVASLVAIIVSALLRASGRLSDEAFRAWVTVSTATWFLGSIGFLALGQAPAVPSVESGEGGIGR